MIDIPFQKGKITKQAHVGIPEGTVEEEYARQGFFGRYAHMFRSEPPIGWTRIEGNLKPQSFDLSKIKKDASDYIQSRSLVVYNNDVKMIYCNLAKTMDYYFRNADGDEVIFVHQGHGQLETDFGPLTFEKGDYIVIPRGTVYRWHPKDACSFVIFESASEVRLPDKGMLGQHALFDPAVVRVPTPEPESPLVEKKKEYELRIQRCSEITKVFYPFCPINTIGWKGTLTVWQINVKDIRPVSSERYHLPPSAHTTFVAQNFVICSFLPRPLETGDPTALKVPFYHSNIDFDEILFYHDGDFFSRDGIKPGMITFHPQGIHHGPQPKAVKAAGNKERTNEVAVMLDTRNPLKVGPAMGAVENIDYWKSWRE